MIGLYGGKSKDSTGLSLRVQGQNVRHKVSEFGVLGLRVSGLVDFSERLRLRAPSCKRRSVFWGGIHEMRPYM